MNKGNAIDFNLKTWSISYALALLCYLPFMLNFLWGNHDWQWVKEYTPLWSGLFEGRFSQFFLPTLLFSGVILPILTIAISLALFTTAGIIILHLYHLPQKKVFYILLTLNITTAPYTLSWFYFAFITLSCLSWTLVIAIAFALLQNNNLSSLLKTLLAIILFTLTLGGYPPVINMICVIFFTLAINDYYQTKKSPLQLIKQYLPHGISIITATLLLLLIQYELKKYQLQYNTYNTAGIETSMLLEKLKTCIKSSFTQFYTNINFINSTYNSLTLIITLAALALLLFNMQKKLSSYLFLSALIIGLLFTSQATLFAAKNEIYVTNEPRILFFSLPYIYAFSASILLSQPKRYIKNICLLFLSCLIFYNFNTSALASKIWVNGMKAETDFAERFLIRLEDNPIFMPQSRRYSFVQGGTLNFRERYYKSAPNEILDPYTLMAPYIPWHLPMKAYSFYYPVKFVSEDFDVYWKYIDSHVATAPEVREYITNKSTIWPAKDSVYLDYYTIILTLSPLGQALAQQWLFNQAPQVLGYPQSQ